MGVVKERDLRFENIRVVSMFFVILVHELDSCAKDTPWYEAVHLLCLTGVPLFFILSGKFAFRIDLKDKNMYSKFYLKKFLKLLIPIFVYMAIKEWHLMAYNFHMEITPWSYIRHLGISVLNGYSYMEYWFLYVLVGMLLTVPFTARMMQQMKKKDYKVFLWIALIMSALMTYVNFLGVEFAVPYYFVGYVLYFYIGYFIDDLTKSKRVKLAICLVGLASFIIELIQLKYNVAFNYKNIAPTYVFVVLSVYILIRDFMRTEKIKRIILFIGKYSLAVYMVHIMVMYFVHDHFHIDNVVLKVIIDTFLIAAGSLLVAFIVDNTLVRGLQKITMTVIAKFSKSKRNVVSLCHG